MLLSEHIKACQKILDESGDMPVVFGMDLTGFGESITGFCVQDAFAVDESGFAADKVASVLDLLSDDGVVFASRPGQI